ncbi:MAG: hypothetical protein JWN32_1079, partial [Solirubrobacterales bacterium]|nr:hypothetical protein [Solirubrobacterales bacterium]
MAKKGDTDLFERLHAAGLRKQVAKTLSEIGASKKVHKAAQSAAAELRQLAEEIEKRVPGTTPAKPAA